MFKKSFLLIVLFFFLTTVGCNRDHSSIKCVSDYISANVDKEDLEKFLQLDGINVHRAWDDLTIHLAEDYFVIEDCKIREYLSRNNANLDSLRGHMILVYSIHKYLNDGYVKQKQVTKKVDKLLAEEE
jgi:hypothetical protein